MLCMTSRGISSSDAAPAHRSIHSPVPPVLQRAPTPPSTQPKPSAPHPCCLGRQHPDARVLHHHTPRRVHVVLLYNQGKRKVSKNRAREGQKE